MKSIILIGFMGTGKSTIGRKIAKMKNMRFLDMDFEIEKREKKTINEIFKNHGETYFREKETKLLKEILNLKNTIISTGGGVIESDYNVRLLKKSKNVIWLDANVDTILNHLENKIDKRPKLKEEKDLKGYIENLLGKRYKKYEKCSNIKISIDNKNIEQVLSDILVYI